jgi:hypothetical protein
MSSWHSLHIAYHDRSGQSDLLLDAVRPLLTELGPDCAEGFVVRHWRRGPHLRLNLRVDSEPAARQLLPSAVRRIEEYLAVHPSRVRLDPIAALPEHERLAEAERDSGPLLPWYPDNTVAVRPFESRADVLGERTAQLVVAAHRVCSPPAFAALDHARRHGTAVQAIAFDLLVLTAARYSRNGLARAALSLRSHAEAHLALTGGPAVRAAWEEHYRRVGAALVARVRLLADPSTTLPDHLGSWLRAVDGLRPAVLAAAEAGELAAGFAQAAGPGEALEESAPRALGEVSPFHATLDTAGESWTRIRDAPWFVAYRFLVNATYLQFTRLGLTPGQRFLICHLAAGAIGEFTGTANSGFPATGLEPSTEAPREQACRTGPGESPARPITSPTALLKRGAHG